MARSQAAEDGYTSVADERGAERATKDQSSVYAALQELRSENEQLKAEVQALLQGQADAARRILTASPSPSVHDLETTLQSHR